MKYIALLGISILISSTLLSIETYSKDTSQCSVKGKTEVETSPEQIIKKLSAYLPEKVITNLNKFREENRDDSKFYLWYKLKDISTSTFLHDIQLLATKSNNKLLFYHYKDYGWVQEHLPLKNISKECANKMVVNFARDFIPSSEELRFINKPSYFSLYDPGHVESWVAEGKEYNYVILVNLDYGYVEYYRAEEK